MKHLGSAMISSLLIALFLAAGTYVVIRHLRKPTSSSWLEYLAKVTENQKSGTLTGADKNGIPLTFEWEKIEVRDPAFIDKSIELKDIYSQAFQPFIVGFIKAHPETVFSDKYFEPLKPFFEKGIDAVDWDIVEKKMIDVSRAVFAHDATKFDERDVCWFVVVKDAESAIGFVQFLVTHHDQWGSIRIDNLMLLPSAQHRGIGKLLTSTVFKIFPAAVKIKFIMLSVMNANKHAIDAYTSYGFIGKPINQDVLDSFIMGYVTDQSDILQKEAEKLE